MKYDWKKIINQNSRYPNRSYSDCQVVTAVNAYYLLTGEIIKQYSPEYRGLCRLARAVNGAALCMNKVWKRLGIEPFREDVSLRTRLDYPMEVNVWYKRCGFHSVLVIDFVRSCDAYRVAGLHWVTTERGWIFGEDLGQLMIRTTSRPWKTRQFRLIK